MVQPFAQGQTADGEDHSLPETEVSKCLQPLNDPSVNNAVAAAAALTELAATQQGEAKAATERLTALIHSLFYSEIVVDTAKNGTVEAESRARDKEAYAASCLRRNVFGHTDPTGHNNALREAQKIRADSAHYVTDARDKLTEVVKAVDAAVQSYQKVGDLATARTLDKALRAVVSRSLKGGRLGPRANGEFNNQMLAGLAVLGLALWATSGSGSYSAPSSSVGSNLSFGRREREELDEQARNREREKAAVDRQHQAWQAEAEAAAQRRSAEADAAARQRAAN